MPPVLSRRDALLTLGAAGLALATPRRASAQPSTEPAAPAKGYAFEISLAQWSLHRALFDKKLDNLDFATVARQTYGISAVEYVNAFFFEKATDAAYIGEMKKRADGEGVRSVLIMCDREGELANSDETKRTRAVENHKKWIDAAAALGCHSIRVNAAGDAEWNERMKHAAAGLRALVDLAEPSNLSVIVENHGGLSSNGEWLAGVMRMVDHPRCGTLPDFGNFCMDWGKAEDPSVWYDRYKGVSELMPFAKGVSAKSYEFDTEGNEIKTDYRRMMKIVLDAGYRGCVGVEYEGDAHSEEDGIKLTKALLEKVRAEMGV